MTVQLGSVGIWTNQLTFVPAREAQGAVAELEALGYGAVWVPESRGGREVFTHAALLLAGSERIPVATGIANLWARDAVAMAGAQKTLAEAYPDRFLLGIGVSHAPLVEGLRGHRYRRPLETMRAYLDAMDQAIFLAVPPATPPQRVLAALGPRMLALAAERAAGAHPYFVPPEHTAQARRALGPGALLAPEQAVVLESDPAKARAIARAHTRHYLVLANYVNNLRRLGFDDDDLTDGGSDRLVDAIVAWGDETAIVERLRAHLDAGADHICVQMLDADPRALPLNQWHELAPALHTLRRAPAVAPPPQS